MADVALLAPTTTLPTATAAATATPAVAIGDAATSPLVADPFASLLAAMAPAAPASAAIPPLTLAASTPIVAQASGEAGPPADAVAAVDLPKDAEDDSPTPVSDVVAMLTFVPPPPAPITAQAQAQAAAAAVPISATRASALLPDTPAASTAASRNPTAMLSSSATPTGDAPSPEAPASSAAAEVIRLLQAGATPIALASPPADQPAPDAIAAGPLPPPATAIPSTGEPAPGAQALAVPNQAAPGGSAPTLRRATGVTAPLAPRATADVPDRVDQKADPDELPAEPRTETRRAVRADTPPTSGLAEPRLAIARTADAPAAATTAPIDDPVVRQLDMARDGQWLDTLAKDIAVAGGKDGQISFRLDPVHLGTLTVQIAQGQDGASVRLSASTEQARAILADAQPRLVAEARAQGLHLREATIDNTPAPAANGSATGSSGGGQGQSRSDQGLSAQLQQNQQQGGRRAPAPAPSDGSPRRAPATPARDRDARYA